MCNVNISSRLREFKDVGSRNLSEALYLMVEYSLFIHVPQESVVGLDEHGHELHRALPRVVAGGEDGGRRGGRVVHIGVAQVPNKDSLDLIQCFPDIVTLLGS